jgi:hypothetical protein
MLSPSKCQKHYEYHDKRTARNNTSAEALFNHHYGCLIPKYDNLTKASYVIINR